MKQGKPKDSLSLVVTNGASLLDLCVEDKTKIGKLIHQTMEQKHKIEKQEKGLLFWVGCIKVEIIQFKNLIGALTEKNTIGQARIIELQKKITEMNFLLRASEEKWNHAHLVRNEEQSAANIKKDAISQTLSIITQQCDQSVGTDFHPSSNCLRCKNLIGTNETSESSKSDTNFPKSSDSPPSYAARLIQKKIVKDLSPLITPTHSPCRNTNGFLLQEKSVLQLSQNFSENIPPIATNSKAKRTLFAKPSEKKGQRDENSNLHDKHPSRVLKEVEPDEEYLIASLNLSRDGPNVFRTDPSLNAEELFETLKRMDPCIVQDLDIISSCLRSNSNFRT